jgi:hypothetical protein
MKLRMRVMLAVRPQKWLILLSVLLCIGWQEDGKPMKEFAHFMGIDSMV